eukprot:205774-Rhodomonas_salina.4
MLMTGWTSRATADLGFDQRCRDLGCEEGEGMGTRGLRRMTEHRYSRGTSVRNVMTGTDLARRGTRRWCRFRCKSCENWLIVCG